MLLKNLFLGLVGTAAIGGIGYGIYSSSQSSDEDKKGDESKEKDQADKAGDKSDTQKEEGDVKNSDDKDKTNDNSPSLPSNF